MQTQSGTGIQALSSRYEETDLLKLLKGDDKFLVLGVYPAESGLAVVSFATKDFGDYKEEIYLDVETSAPVLNLSTKKNVAIVNNVLNLDKLREILSEGTGKYKRFTYLLLRPVFKDEYLSYEAELIVGDQVISAAAAGPRPCPPDCPKPPYPLSGLGG